MFFRAFYLGFHSVCASNALIMLRPEEVEQLVCGCPTLDLLELRKVTYYDGFKQEDQTIQYFWEVKNLHTPKGALKKGRNRCRNNWYVHIFEAR